MQRSGAVQRLPCMRDVPAEAPFHLQGIRSITKALAGMSRLADGIAPNEALMQLTRRVDFAGV